MDIDKALEILHLPRTTSPEEIKSAYRDLVRVWHPDRFGKDERLRWKAEEQLRLINEAHEALRRFRPDAPTDGDSTDNAEQPDRSSAGPLEIRGMSLWMIRMLARWIDLLLLVSVMGVAGIFGWFHPNLFSGLLMSVGTSLLWVFVEANLISLIHTTPGKWILGFYFAYPEGGSADLLFWLKRSFRVWMFGLGAGLWVILPVTWGVVLARNARGLPLPWEFSDRCSLKRRPVSVFRNWIGLSMVPVFGACIFLSIRGIPSKTASMPNPSPHISTEKQPVVSISSAQKAIGALADSPHGSLKVSTEHKPTSLAEGDGGYERFMDAERMRCRDKIDCMPEHVPSRIKQVLISDYTICNGSCAELDRLPEGLRFFGVEQTSELLSEIFRTIDQLHAIRLEVSPRQAVSPATVDCLEERLDTLLKTLVEKKFGHAQEKLDRFVLDYTRMSERFFLGQKEMLPAAIEAQKARERQEAERRRRQLLEEQERKRDLRSGARKPTNRAEAMEAFSPLDGMPIVWTPPLPPLSDALLTPAYSLSGTLEGVEAVDGDIYYRVTAILEGKSRFFLFHPAPSLAKRQFLTGESIWMVGKLEGVVRFRTQAGKERYLPLFVAEFIE